LYDPGDGPRRWRSLDAGTTKVFIEAAAPRVNCRRHAVTVAAVPWARHDARHTRDFDDQVAWLVTHTSKTAVVELMRVSWRTVGAIAARVVADGRVAHDPFDDLVRIGIDEISYRRGHKYLMVVVDHDTGRLVWLAEGHDRATLQQFFDLLGAERASKIKLVSADAAEWIVAGAGLSYLIGRPAEKTRRAFGIARILAAMFLHWFGDSLLGLTGGAAWAVGIYLPLTIVNLAHSISLYRKTVAKERNWARALLAAEVDHEVITAGELDAAVGSRKQRKHFVKSQPDHGRTKNVLEATIDLADEIAVAYANDTPEVEHARAEIARLRG
jgi:Transposase/Helix-turn-helix domain of transposase family ISL3